LTIAFIGSTCSILIGLLNFLNSLRSSILKELLSIKSPPIIKKDGSSLMISDTIFLSEDG